jgi:FkbH-like protein
MERTDIPGARAPLLAMLSTLSNMTASGNLRGPTVKRTIALCVSTFAELKRHLKKDYSHLRKVRVAVLADSATQLLVQALRGAGFESGLDLNIYEADYDQVERQIVETSSELYGFAPEFVLIFQSTEKLHSRFQRVLQNERTGFAANEITVIRQHLEMLTRRMPVRVIYMNFPEVDDGVFGSFANKISSSWLSQLRRLNTFLMDLAEATPELFVCDLSILYSQYGRDWMSNRRIALTTQLLLSIDALPVVAQRVVDIIAAAGGRFKKCLILDLDNTLWGGVIGDDGIENIEIGELGIGPAFSQLQSWAKDLKNRGVILAVCTKNDPLVAAKPFESHPDMVLRMDDFAVFVASWENKADSIRHVQSVLEIGFDSMVFLDDNPAEREIVRKNLPEVCVPELPEDPADYLEFLQRSNLFETVTVTAEDAERTRQYQAEGRRRVLKSDFETEDAFLRSLTMMATVQGLTPFNIPRVVQLTQRSNQFNLRTVRYSEDEIRRIAQSGAHIAIAFNLQDNLGDYGLVSVVILERSNGRFFIDTWLMSCRVLRRGMEALVLNTLVERVRAEGCTCLVGEYLPTPKNALVRDHYATLGFTAADGRWYLDIATFSPRPTYIKYKAPPDAQ